MLFRSQKELTQGIYCYPNPVKDELYLICDQETPYSLSDLSGAIIIHGIVTQNKTKIDLSKVAAGSYLLRTAYGVNRIIKE